MTHPTPICNELFCRHVTRFLGQLSQKGQPTYGLKRETYSGSPFLDYTLEDDAPRSERVLPCEDALRLSRNKQQTAKFCAGERALNCNEIGHVFEQVLGMMHSTEGLEGHGYTTPHRMCTVRQLDVFGYVCLIAALPNAACLPRHGHWHKCGQRILQACVTIANWLTLTSNLRTWALCAAVCGCFP